MTPIDTRSISALLDSVTRGSVLRPGSAEFADEVTGFNVAVTHSPAAVVLAHSADDVAAAVRVSADAGFGVAVKCTGHGARAIDGDNVMVSTRLMTQLTIDPDSCTATVGAGVLWQQVLDAAAVFGLGAPSGSSTAAGAVGYTLGGGLSPLGRTIGFAADLVRSFEIVTAGGKISRVDTDSNGELFWALRGSGGGAYGIVTEMVIDLLPIHSVYGGGIFFDVDDAPAVLETWRSWTQSVPESVSTSLALLHLPPEPGLPEELCGRTVMHLRYAHIGSDELGQKLLEPMRNAADAIVDTVSTMPLTAMASIHMDPVEPLPVIERGLLLTEMTDQTVAAVLSAVDLPIATVELRLMGGALDRPTRAPSSVGGRGAAFCVFLIGVAEPSLADDLPDMLDLMVARFGTDSAGRSYLNLAGTGSMDLVRAGWTRDELDRLESVRQSVDPTGLLTAAARW